MSFFLRRGVMSSAALSGTTTYAASTANINGTSQNFSCNDSAVKRSNDTVWACWAYVTSSASNKTIMGRYISSGNQRSLIIQRSTSGTIRIVTSTDGVGANVDTTTFTVALNTWTLITLRLTGGNIYISKNNDSEESFVRAAPFVGTAPLDVGGNGGGSAYGQGYLAFPKVYNTGSIDRAALYNNGTPECWDDLGSLQTNCIYAPRLANWTGEVGNELVDQSSTGATTTNVGSTPFTGSGLNVECST